MATDIKTNITAGTDSKYGTAKPYTLPAATASTLGGVKVGDGLAVTADGTLSAEGETVFVYFTYDASTGTATAKNDFAETFSALQRGVKGFAGISFKTGEDSAYLVVEIFASSENKIKSESFFMQVDRTGNPSYKQLDYASPEAYSLTWTKSNVFMSSAATSISTMSSDSFSVDKTHGYLYGIKDGGITSAKLADGAVTADKIASGAITADKLASGVGGGIKVRFVSDILSETTNSHVYAVLPDYPNVCFYLKIGANSEDITTVIYGQIEFGDYVGILGIGLGYSGSKYYGSTGARITLVSTKTISNLNPTTIGLCGPGSTQQPSYLYSESSSTGVSLQFTNFFNYKWNFFPKSTSAQAALATLLPVQDECEQMEAEVTKLEQDWIDNPDETVAVDGNGVPVTISTKKTALEAKKAELEKLREDYFSKLGDWKNEVQE